MRIKAKNANSSEIAELLVFRTEEFARWNLPSNQTAKHAPIAPSLEILDPRSHDQSVYPSNDQELSASNIPSRSTCFNCKKTGHWSSHCPEKSISDRDKQNLQGQNVLLRVDATSKEVDIPAENFSLEEFKHEMDFEQLISSFDDDYSPIHEE
ncbi:hypothetical protein K3495_g9032 [Podosphaera aphanis]|nr:hypothetical protein K3495_g9032 [Podosphaera aphanis]